MNRPGGACQYAPAMVRRYLVSLLVVFLAACETPVVTQTLPELTYGHLSKFTLDVAAIAVKAKYVPPMKAPNVEHLFATPPGKAPRRWAADRPKAGGRRGSARFARPPSSWRRRLKVRIRKSPPRPGCGTGSHSRGSVRTMRRSPRLM